MSCELHAEGRLVTDLEGQTVIAESLEGAAEVYRILSRIYREEPDGPFLTELRTARFPAQTGNELMDKGYRRIVSYLSRVGLSAQSDLAVDYSRTFIGGGVDSYAAAYPYESVHAGRKRLTMQGARDEVLAIYRAYGLEKREGAKNGEDHIAYELEFLEILCRRCAEALRDGRDEEAESLALAQRNFLEDHLLNWAGDLTSQMRHFSKTDFYKGASYLTAGCLEEHAALLEEALDDSVGRVA